MATWAFPWEDSETPREALGRGLRCTLTGRGLFRKERGREQENNKWKIESSQITCHPMQYSGGRRGLQKEAVSAHVPPR